MTYTNAWLAKQDPAKVEEVLDKAKQSLMWADVIRYVGNDNEEFALWYFLVNRKVMGLVGIGVMDLGDFNSYDAWAGGMSAGEAAREALQNDDTYSALFGGE